VAVASSRSCPWAGDPSLFGRQHTAQAARHVAGFRPNRCRAARHGCAHHISASATARRPIASQPAKIALDWSPGCRLIPEAAAKNRAVIPRADGKGDEQAGSHIVAVRVAWPIFPSDLPERPSPPTVTASHQERRVAFRAAFWRCSTR